MHRLSWSKHLGGGLHLQPRAAYTSKTLSGNSRRSDDSGGSDRSKNDSGGSASNLAGDEARVSSVDHLDALALEMKLGPAAFAAGGGGGGGGSAPRVFSRTRLAMSRSYSSESASTFASDWGFYEEPGEKNHSSSGTIGGGGAASVEVPDYVLEADFESQALWHATAGQRPAQPAEERRAWEAAMRANFENSAVDYKSSEDHLGVPRICRPVSEAERLAPKQLLREPSPFGTSVTKSWQCECCGERTSLMIRIPKFQIIKEHNNSDVRAEYLVVARLGGVTFGIWRRHSHFLELCDLIKKESDADLAYRNTLWSWRCLKRRQRLFRCLDKDYLAVKCFLLERFLHDAVFEAPSSAIFATFLGLKCD